MLKIVIHAAYSHLCIRTCIFAWQLQAYMHGHMHMHTHTHTHMHAHTRTHAHTHACMHTYMHTHIHTHTCTHAHTHPHIHTHTHSYLSEAYIEMVSSGADAERTGSEHTNLLLPAGPAVLWLCFQCHQGLQGWCSRCAFVCRHPVVFSFCLNTFHAGERGPCSSWLCWHHSQNEAFIPRTLLLLSWKTAKWNRFQNELPSDEGRDPDHFLLHHFDFQIGENMMASQRNISFLKHWIRTFHGWWLQAWICWLGQWMGVGFWINWWGGERNCIREWWQHCNVNCRNVSIFIGSFLSQPNFAPLSPSITWARGSMLVS